MIEMTEDERRELAERVYRVPGSDWTYSYDYGLTGNRKERRAKRKQQSRDST